MSSTESPQNGAITIDCRGMQGPASILEVMKVAKKQEQRAQLTVLATDETFPTELEAWCRASQNRVEKLSKGDDGAFVAVIIVNDAPSNRPSVSPSQEKKIPSRTALSAISASRGVPIVSPSKPAEVSTSDATNIGIPLPEPAKPQDSTQIGPAPQKSSKTGVAALPPLPPEPPKSRTGIVLPSTPEPPKSARSGVQSVPPPIIAVPPAEEAPKNVNRNAPTQGEFAAIKPAPEHAPEPENATQIGPIPQKSSKTGIGPAPVAPAAPEREEPIQEATQIGPVPQKSSKTGAVSAVPPPPAVSEPFAKEDFDEPSEPRDSSTEAGITVADLSGLPADKALTMLSTMLAQSIHQKAHVLADTPGFEAKLKAWAQSENIQISELHQNNGRLSAIVFPGPPPITHQTQPVPFVSTPPEPQGAPSLKENRGTFCVVSKNIESLYVAMMMATSSAAQGTPVDIFFSFWGVGLLRSPKPKPKAASQGGFWRRFFQAIVRFFSPKGPRRLRFASASDGMWHYLMKQNNSPTLDVLFQMAVQQRIRFLVCATSMGMMGLSKEDLMELPNIEVTEISEFAEIAKKASFQFSF